MLLEIISEQTLLRIRSRVASAIATATQMQTNGFDFQHAAFYECSIVTTAIKCTVFELGT